MKDRIDIHQHITDAIVASIERGVGDFQLPWHRPGNIMSSSNVLTKNRYRGVNILVLWAYAEESGYSSGLWGTYRQWATVGAQVRKGEKASYIVFYKSLEFPADRVDPYGEMETRPWARASAVFAAEQVEGYALPVQVPEMSAPVLSHDAAEALIGATGAKINHGGDRAYYRRSTDSIQLPSRESFVGTATSTPTEAYYSTLLHELTHWTAPSWRCNRELGRRFGDQAYAMEELVAELGAAFLCADLGVTPAPRPDHAHYLAHWLWVMKADKKAIFTAASKASDAATFLAGHVRQGS